MEKMGVELSKTPVPAVFYIGFNMDDPVVGSSGGESARKLRQAMSLAIDSEEFIRLFMNDRGIPADSPIPPGIFGHEVGTGNPFREPDADRARRLLEEAGYPRGVDPETGRALRLGFTTSDTSARGHVRYQFFIDSWRRIGLDVGIIATNYNQFQDQIRRGAFQTFFFGWSADYPDPENFLFLLWGPNATSENPGAPNASNFSDPRFDALFPVMKDMPNGPERAAAIREMRDILERERPWIELYHAEVYALYHGWIANVKPAGISLPTSKYVDIDPALRSRERLAWNEPIVWPAWAFAAAFVAIAAPGVITFFRERQ
jgi:ABC-type transport system substrate-binding protein